MVRHENLIRSVSSLRSSQTCKWIFLLIEQIFTYTKDKILETWKIPTIPHHYFINCSNFPVTWNKCPIVLWVGIRNLSNSFNLTCGHNDRSMHPPHYPDSSLPGSLTLPKPGNMHFRGAQTITPSHISELVQPESHILQACHNHIRTVHTGLFSTWYNSYIGTGEPEPRRIVIPNIFRVLFWKEKHVSHITQILKNDLALLVKAFCVSTKVCCQGKRIINQ